MRMALKSVVAVLTLTCGGLGGVASADEDYPSRPVKLVVAFPAGTQPDIMARIAAQALSPLVRQVIIENRPGAGGTIASKAVTAAEPDGYTLLMGGMSNLATSPAIYRNAGYDPVSSFAPVGLLAKTPFLLAVSRDLPVKTLPELIAYAKAHPGRLNFGGATGTPPHLICQWFKTMAGIDIVHVPYTSGAQAVTDLLGGQVQISCEATSLLLPHALAGRITPLAVMNTTRFAELPDLPTTAEGGLPDLLVNVWTGVVAPPRTPERIIEKLNAALNSGIRSDQVKASLDKLSAYADPMSPQEFRRFVANEFTKWSTIVKLSGAVLE